MKFIFDVAHYYTAHIQEEKDIVNTLREKEDLSFLDSSKLSELKEKVEKIHLKLHKSDE